MSDDDTYEIPLQDQRVFGAGIKRKRVRFVPSSSNLSTSTLPASRTSGASIGDFYLNLVLPKGQKSAIEQNEEAGARSGGGDSPPICDICNLPLESTASPPHEETKTKHEQQQIHAAAQLQKSTPHEAALAHQVSLPHSHPPSHIDRHRLGLSYLKTYGWDPDSRTGLGASGQGSRFPVKTAQKYDKLGVGAEVPRGVGARGSGRVEKEKRKTRLDAGATRRGMKKEEEKMRGLREEVYGRVDVERLLYG